MTNLPVKTRFAPSPTGLLHLGSIRAALFSYLFAKSQGGSLLLRIEDTDLARSEPQFIEALQEDLRWLGLLWEDGPYFQSQRNDIYEGFYRTLLEQGHAYPCYCTQTELEVARKIQIASGKPPRYPGTCLHLSETALAAKKAAGIEPTIRFKMPSGPISFVDGIQGPKVFQGKDIGDFIIKKGDGSSVFMFCNAIDDSLMGVTHVVRGEDHLTNTPRQLAILKVLSLRMPDYAHFPMVVGKDGKPLAKRNGSTPIQLLREQGFFPESITNYMARLGHTYSTSDILSIEELATRFSVTNVARSASHFDTEHMLHTQKMVLAQKDTATLIEWMRAHGVTGLETFEAEAFIRTIRNNILFPNEAQHFIAQWAEPKFDWETLGAEAASLTPAFLAAVTAILQEGFPDYATMVASLKQKTALQGRALFMPLRILLTGETKGPELAEVWGLLGQKRVEERVKWIEAHHRKTS